MEKMSLEEMAEIAPEPPDLTVNSNRLLYLCNMLRELTLPGEGITIDDICDILEAKAKEIGVKDYRPSRATIQKDLKAIRECEPLNITVHTPQRGHTEGFWCENLAINNAQLCMLINIVQACSFISQRQCNELVGALKTMIPTTQQDVIPKDVYVDNAIKADDVDVFNSLNEISRAIKKNKKVKFKYFNYDSNGRKTFLDGNADGWYIETPIGIIFSNNAYYLETWDKSLEEEENTRTNRYRLDRACDMTVSEIDADKGEHIKNLKRSIGQRASMCVDMLGDGITRYLALEVNKGTGLNATKNKFGKYCTILNGETEDTSIALIKVQLSPTFYRWLFGHYKNIKIIEPNHGWWGKWVDVDTKENSSSRLMTDYKAAMRGYNNQLKQALSNIANSDKLDL